VLCVGTDPPEHPVKQGHAWVVGTNDLVNLIREQR
jgi:hypothetical protein